MFKTLLLILTISLILVSCTAAPGGAPAGTTPGAAGSGASGTGYDDYGQPAGGQAAGGQAGANPPAATAPPPATPTQPSAAPVETLRPTITLPSDAPAANVTNAPPTTDPGGAAAPAATNTSAPAAAAQPTFTQAAVVPQTGAAMPVISTDDFLDYQVVDPNGAPVGEVQDLVIDLPAPNTSAATGSVSYVVVNSALNDDWLVAVPWQYVQLRPEWRAVVLPVNANQLFSAPGFDEDFWPVSFSADYKATLDRFWQNPAQAPQAGQQQPPAQPAPGQLPTYLRASDLNDIDVLATNGFELGEIQEVAIDWKASQPGATAAQFSYVVMDRGDLLGPGGELVAIPWSLIKTVPNQDVVILNMTPEQIRTAPGFNQLAWPDLYAEPWTTQLNQFWANIR